MCRAASLLANVSRHSRAALHGETLTEIVFKCFWPLFSWPFCVHFVKAVYHEAGVGGVLLPVVLYAALSAW